MRIAEIFIRKLQLSTVWAYSTKRTDKEGGFEVVRRRCVVEHTFSWLRRNRCLMAHDEAVAIVAEGFAKLAVMLKRLTKPTPSNPS